jgi:RND family efflux transporter MFP subunit
LDLRTHELEELEKGYLPEEIEQAQAKMRGAEALWKFATARLKRTSELYRQNRSATAEQLDEAVQQEAAAHQAFISAKAELKLVEDGPRLEKVQQAKARVDQAHQVVLRLEDMEQKYTIRAPFEGFIVAKHTEVGAWISQGDPVVEIVKLDVVDVDVSVPEADVRNLRQGDVVEVRFEATSGSRSFPGKIWRIIPQADPRSRTFPVKVRLQENPNYPESPLIKAGMLARVLLPVSFQVGLFVPKDALALNRGRTSLFVVRDDGRGAKTVQMVPVTLGDSQGNLIQVVDAGEDLREGDLVVTRGNERLRPGEAVEIKKAPD